MPSTMPKRFTFAAGDAACDCVLMENERLHTAKNNKILRHTDFDKYFTGLMISPPLEKLMAES